MTTPSDRRIALVTGSTSGIGEAIAVALARDGVGVIVNGRDPAKTSEAAARIAATVPEAQIFDFAADIATAEGADALHDRFERVDILVNNAAIFEAKPIFDVTDEEWLRYFETNVLSGVRLARKFMPGMIERGWGRVMFISSDSSVFIPTEMVHYAMTKTAQLAVSRGLAQHVAGTGVTVNAVLPGPTLTPGVRTFIEAGFGAGDGFEAAAARFVAQELPTSLLGRLIQPEEVAAMVRYLASPDASATTGAAIRVDGGVAPTIIP